MEGHHGGLLKGYWKRMQYQRLDGGGRRWRRGTSHHHRVELASGARRADGAGPRRRRFWRVKVAPRLGFLRRAVSPRRLLTRIRDAYVRMMLSFASSPAISGGGFGYYGGDVVATTGLGRPALKEYDEKVIVEIYRSLMAQGQLIAVAKDGGGQAPQVVPRLLRP